MNGGIQEAPVSVLVCQLWRFRFAHGLLRRPDTDLTHFPISPQPKFVLTVLRKRRAPSICPPSQVLAPFGHFVLCPTLLLLLSFNLPGCTDDYLINFFVYTAIAHFLSFGNLHSVLWRKLLESSFGWGIRFAGFALFFFLQFSCFCRIQEVVHEHRGKLFSIIYRPVDTPVIFGALSCRCIVA